VGRVREKVPAANLAPVLAVSGATECLAANELHSTGRDIVWPTRNPWYSGDVSDNDDGVIALINTSERPARVWDAIRSAYFIRFRITTGCHRADAGLFGDHR